VRFVTGREVSPYVVVRGAVHVAIQQAYDARERGQKIWRGAAAGSGPPPQISTVLPDGDETWDAPEAELVPLEVEGEFIDLGDDEPLGPPDQEVVISVRATGRRTVLVVDDEPEIRQLVQRALEKHGYAVETAADGLEAVQKAEALLPDLILLDAMLPKLHGFEACRRIKSAPRTRAVPVIMMTAIYRGWRFAQDARDAYGAEDYVEKPFRFEDLLRRMEAVLESTASRPPGEAGAGPFILRGKELLAANKLPEAQAQFEAALQVDPYSAEAHAQLARTLRARGEVYGAMTAFERAAELKPGWLPVLRALASLYEEKGFHSKATEALERALAAAGDDATRATLRQDLMVLLG
jgi:DNA-binding response OmpR family regulator